MGDASKRWATRASDGRREQAMGDASKRWATRASERAIAGSVVPIAVVASATRVARECSSLLAPGDEFMADAAVQAKTESSKRCAKRATRYQSALEISICPNSSRAWAAFNRVGDRAACSVPAGRQRTIDDRGKHANLELGLV